MALGSTGLEMLLLVTQTRTVLNYITPGKKKTKPINKQKQTCKSTIKNIKQFSCSRVEEEDTLVVYFLQVFNQLL